MFVLTRPALTVIGHCWPPTAWTGLVGCKITKKSWNGKEKSEKNAFSRKILLPLHSVMSDFAFELAKLLSLEGSDFIQQLKLIASLRDFRLLDGETGIFTVGGEKCGDYNNLLNAAHKAVSHGYRVYILPNPKGVRSADFIFEQKGIYKLYDLKTISGSASVGNRLKESIGQTNRVLLNMKCSYEGRLLASEIKKYFQIAPNAVEVMIFKGNKIIIVDRIFVNNPQYDRLFRKRYER